MSVFSTTVLIAIIVLLYQAAAAAAQPFVRCETPSNTPSIVVLAPQQGWIKGEDSLSIVADGIDSRPRRIAIYVNQGAQPVIVETDFRFQDPQSPNQATFARRLVVGEPAENTILLQEGLNTVEIHVWDAKGICNRKVRHVSASRGHAYAVVIGISEYRRAGKLKYAHSDAQRFRDHLVNVLNIADNRITMLVNEKATQREINKALDALGELVDKNDTVIVFFSGHGYYSAEPRYNKRAYFLPADAELRSPSTLLAQKEFLDRIDELGAGRRILFVDACFSGGQGAKSQTPIGGKDAIEPLWKAAKGVYGILSSDENQLSWEDDQLQHGVFTYYLLEAFRQAQADKRGYVRLRDAFYYVRDNVRSWALQRQREQDPVEITHTSYMADIPFGIKGK